MDSSQCVKRIKELEDKNETLICKLERAVEENKSLENKLKDLKQVLNENKHF